MMPSAAYRLIIRKKFSDSQAEALCKQMFALGLDIVEKSGKCNLISTGRGLGDMGTALAAIKPAEASTINTFTKNILFTAIYINKQVQGCTLNSLVLNRQSGGLKSVGL